MSFKRALIFALLSCAFVLPSRAFSNDEPEYAPIVEHKFDLPDLAFKTIDGRDFNLREFSKGKRLVMIHYFAGWCHNSIQNGHIMKRLYDKYRDRGFGVVSVSQYSRPEDVRIYVNRIGLENPIVTETDSRNARRKSSHYRYRTAIGDKRQWGTPFYLIVRGSDILPAPEGGPEASPFASRVFTVSGELIEAEADRFIERALAGAS